MMNDMSIENLQKRIKELEEENLQLKHLVNDLQNELAISGKNYNSDEPITISNYYLKKYLSIHDDVYQRRLNKLEEQRQKLQNEYDMIMKQEEGMDVIAAHNEASISRIKEIDEEINNLYYELEKFKFEFENDVKNVTQQETKITNDTLDILSRIYKLFNGSSSNEAVLREFDHAMELLKKVIYPINIQIITKKNELINRLDKLNSLEQETKITIKTKTSEKDSLEQAIQTISLETIDTMLDSLALELTKVNKSKEELTELFKMLKDQNLRKVQDEIKHLQVLEYTNKDIAYEMDKIMEKYEQELITVDTVSNVQLKLTMELSKLTTRLSELEPLKKEYEQKHAEYSQVASILETASSNIKQLEEYVNLTAKAINSNPNYSEIVSRYEGYIATASLLKQEIENLTIKIKDLKEERRLKSFDPYAKASIHKITDEIVESESLKQKYELDLENTNQEIQKISSAQQNLKLMNVLKDKKAIEQKLPALYDQQKELNTIVSMKYDELVKLEESVKEYEDVAAKIEEIKREIDSQ